MQIKKEVLLFSLLIALCVTLIVAADISGKAIPAKNDKVPECCQGNNKAKAASPWNFITNGLLHISA